jgi:hypothetical protein
MGRPVAQADQFVNAEGADRCERRKWGYHIAMTSFDPGCTPPSRSLPDPGDRDETLRRLLRAGMEEHRAARIVSLVTGTLGSASPSASDSRRVVRVDDSDQTSPR